LRRFFFDQAISNPSDEVLHQKLRKDDGIVRSLSVYSPMMKQLYGGVDQELHARDFNASRAAACSSAFAADDPPKVEKEPPPTEDIVRKRFLITYQSAKTSAGKADAVAMLKGMTDKESRRLLAGMLGDHDESVRLAACRAMSETPDADGYFVKPLMGALTDSSDFVRNRSRDALGSAKIRVRRG